MKKYIILAALAVIAACTKPENPATKKSYTYKVTIGENDWGIQWKAGDKLWPCTEGGFKENVSSALVNGAGSLVGEFRNPDCLEVCNMIAYPYGSAIDVRVVGSTVWGGFRHELTYEQLGTTRVMLAQGFGRVAPEYLNTVSLTLLPAVSVVRVKLTNIPAKATALYLGADKRISGDFTLAGGSFETKDEQDGQVKVILPQNDGTLEFCIAVPTGSYKELRVRLSQTIGLHEFPLWPSVNGDWRTVASFGAGRRLEAGTTFNAGEVNVE